MSWVTWLPKSRMRMRSVMGWIVAKGASSVARKGSARPRSFRFLRALRHFHRRRLARQHGDEDPVGPVARRREAQYVALDGRRAADGLGPDRADRQQREIVVSRQKCLYLRLVLLAQQRTGGIDQTAAGLGQPRCAAENL